MSREGYLGLSKAWSAMVAASVLLFAGGGCWYYRQGERSVRAARYDDLKAIAELKTGQLTAWRQERLAAVRWHASGNVGLRAADWVRSRDGRSQAVLRDWLLRLRDTLDYRDVLLAAPDGRLLLALDPRPAALEPGTRQLVSRALSSRQAVLGDFFVCPDCGEVHLDVAAPVSDPAGRPLAALILRSDPERSIYPLMRSWPLPSRSAETMLARREGEGIVFLNRLRHSTAAPLSIRETLSQDQLPAVQAVLGKTGQFDGRDYRGVRVLADLRAVPDTPWFMVAKVDADELLAEARSRGLLTAIIAGLGMLLVGILAFYLNRLRTWRLQSELWSSEKERLETREEIRATLYGIGDGVIATDSEGRVARMNPVAEQLTGWSEAQAQGQPLAQVFRIVNEETRAAAASPVERVLREGVVVGLANHTLLLAKDGAERPIADSGAPIRGSDGAIAGVVLVFRDQSTERAAQQGLAESERKYRLLFEDAQDGLAVADAETGRLLDCNEALCRMVGRSKPELLGQSQAILHPPQALSDGFSAFFQRHRKDDVDHPLEDVLAAKGGRLIPVEIRGSRLRVEDRDCLLGVFRDITARKKAEASIRRLSSALEQSPVLVVMTDLKGDIEYVNPRFCAVTGYAAAEVLGRNPRLLQSGETPAAEYRRLWEAISSGGEWRGEFHNKKKDGSLYWERAAISSVRDAAGERIGYLAVIEDITAEKALEGKLFQAQKMESVGRLAGGVAHDFNNLLTAINGYAQFVMEGLAPGDPKREDVKEILAAGERAAGLTRQLLAFSRKQILNPVVLDMNAALGGTLRMLKRLIGEDIAIETRLAARPCRVKVDPGQIDQILMNLAVNARDAMPEGGTLTVSTELLEMPEAWHAERPWLPTGPLVRLRVSDTGVGMDETVKTHLFEPFFTTKERGKGTGLGLSTVYGIVRQSGGEIVVESSPGAGTHFSIFLPQVAADAPAPARDAGGAVTGGSETVLLVEDEETVRRLSLKVLTRCGYKVLAAANGRTALQLLSEHGPTVDLLITDVVMPGMNGRELAKAAAKLCPEMRTLYMSGYTDNAIVHHGVLDPGLAFLYKPFTPESLALKVRTVLDSPSERARP